MTDLEKGAWACVGVGAATVATSGTGVFLPLSLGWIACAIGLCVAIVAAIARE